MKEIKIVNQEKVALVDDEDFELVNKYRWYVRRTGGHYKGKTTALQTKDTVNGKRNTIYMHRLVTNAPDGLLVDHINRDVFDNRKDNLRVCDKQSNSFNRGSTNPLGYKGVSLRKDKEFSKPRFRAYININYKRINLGTFDTAEEAALAYNKAALEHFGEFANINIIKV